MPHWQQYARNHYPRRQLVNFPRTYFEVKDVRPGEEEGQAISEEIFVPTAGGASIPKELNQTILQLLRGKEFFRIKMVSKMVEMVVKYCHTLMYDAIHEQIGELNIDQSRRQVNEHRFKVANCVRIFGGGGVNGYCVRVTPKYVYFLHDKNIFKQHPDIQKVRNKLGVAHMHPYVGNVVEVVRHWHIWGSMTQEFLD